MLYYNLQFIKYHLDKLFNNFMLQCQTIIYKSQKKLCFHTLEEKNIQLSNRS